MMTEIEQFVLGGNIAQDVIMLSIAGSDLVLELQSCQSHHERKRFLFKDIEIEYEHSALESEEKLEFPLPLIGIDSSLQVHGKWRFVINTGDTELAYISEWPVKT